MIAFDRIEPEPEPEFALRRRVSPGDRSRAATRARFVRAQRRAYLAFLRVGGIAALLVLPLMFYVMLTANLTGMNYTLAKEEARKATLLAQTMRQDDRIAKLESRERLAALAARLGMHDPQIYAVATLPPAADEPAGGHGIALLGAVGEWLDSTVGGSPR